MPEDAEDLSCFYDNCYTHVCKMHVCMVGRLPVSVSRPLTEDVGAEIGFSCALSHLLFSQSAPCFGHLSLSLSLVERVAHVPAGRRDVLVTFGLHSSDLIGLLITTTE